LKRAWVGWVQASYRLTQRRACRVTGVARSLLTYRLRRPGQEPLRRRLKELSEVRVSYGYRRLHVLLRREGWPINHKRVYRLYREEGLVLKRKRPKRRRSAVARPGRPEVWAPNERWAMDFMHDTLASGEKLRVLTVVDVFTRECLALEARRSFRGRDVAAVLSDLVLRQGLPRTIQCDQGTEFTSVAMDHWAWLNAVRMDFSRPGKPGDNAINEAFNGSVRRECLSQHYFLNVEEAQRVLETWRQDYNNERPHGSLAQLSPTSFRVSWKSQEVPSELQNLPVGWS
jgi:putative transposase